MSDFLKCAVFLFSTFAAILTGTAKGFAEDQWTRIGGDGWDMVGKFDGTYKCKPEALIGLIFDEEEKNGLVELPILVTGREQFTLIS